MIGRWLFAATSTFFSLMPILIYLVAGEQLIQRVPVLGNTMTLGAIVTLTLLQFRLFFPLAELTSLQVEFQEALTPFERIFEYLDMPIEIQDKPDALYLESEKTRGEVTFSHKRDELRASTNSSTETIGTEQASSDSARLLSDPPSTQQTAQILETQISHPQPSEVTMQKKITRKLPIRVASKEEVLSTNYLLPSVREIFIPNSENEEE